MPLFLNYSAINLNEKNVHNELVGFLTRINHSFLAGLIYIYSTHSTGQTTGHHATDK